jgi:CheY-like chemotaxis protein
MAFFIEPAVGAEFTPIPRRPRTPGSAGISGISLALTSFFVTDGTTEMETRTLPTAPDPRRILVVEDDGSYRWVLRRLLESAFGDEVAVEEAPTGDAALDRIAQAPAFDLILLDLSLPGASGFEILERLRAGERTRRVPVIVVTSSQEAADVTRAYELGANSFVSKSDSPEKTLQRLRLLPVYWLELNRLPEDASEASRRSTSSRTSSARP